MPTLADIIDAVTTFVSTYSVFIAAGAVAGLAVYGTVRLIKGSR